MHKGTDPKAAAAGLRLLLVGEKESDFLSLRDLLLRVAGRSAKLDHAPTHSEALALLGRAAYDLVLCDYRSHDRAVLKLTQQLRKRSPRIPLVFLSDYSDHTEDPTGRPPHKPDGGGVPATPDMAAIRCAIDLFCKERQRNAAEQMLRKLRRAVEQTSEMVIVTDPAGVIEFVNPTFEQLTSYSEAEALGRNLRILKSRQQSAVQYEEMWRTVVEGDVFQGMVFNRKKNGESFLSEKVITPLRDEQGRISNFVCTDRDVSERVRLEAQLQQAQKMDAIGRLAGGVAHDFNNLLMVISAYAELMQDSLAAEHPLRRNIAEIMTAANRATDLTRQLLAFGRKQMQALRVLDLNGAIQEVVRMLPRIIGEDIQLVFTPGKDLGKVKADPVQIEQVVMNLAVNARDAMPRGGKLTVETANMHLDEAYIHRHSMVPAGDYVLLTVSDEGQGIAPEHVAHIFEPFYTTKREGKGTGLGLATVYGIIKQSRGFVWVYSELGLGTTFKVYLPRVRQANHHKPAPSAAAEERPQGWGTLLLVEDEAAVRKSEREFLELSGYTVLEAENGEQALRLARDHKGDIHLVITDVVMPRMGGPEMARLLAADRPQIKVLFVSGYAENTVLQHGAIDMTARFLQKPFTLKSLTRKVWQILGTDNALAAAATN